MVTNVGTAHIENFADGQAGIARAKFELVAALPSTGVAFLNCDDPYVSQFGRDFPGRVVYFGAAPAPIPQLLEVSRRSRPGCTSRFRAGEREGQFTLQLLGAHNALNAVAGLAVALEAGVALDAAVAALAIAHRRRQARPGHRNRRRNDPERQLQLQSRGAAFDDPHPGRASRRAAGFWWPARCSKWASTAPRCTLPAARAAAEAGLDLVVGVQGNAEHLAAAACAGGVAIAVSARRRSRRPLAQTESAARRRGSGEGLARRASGAGHRGALPLADPGPDESYASTALPPAL